MFKTCTQTMEDKFDLMQSAVKETVDTVKVDFTQFKESFDDWQTDTDSNIGELETAARDKLRIDATSMLEQLLV